MPKPPRPTAQLPHDSRAFRHAPNIAFKTDSRITRVRPRRRNPAGKTAKSTNGKFAAPQRFEKQRQKYRPSRWMPISTGTATSS
jgi:hypothetical protein